jgi:hypothetical protein
VGAKKVIPFIKSPVEQWQRDHNAALQNPVGIENPLISLIDGWIKYAERWHGLYAKHIESDQNVALQWALLGRGIQAFIRCGPTGRLDSDTLFSLVGEKLSARGFSFE